MQKYLNLKTVNIERVCLTNPFSKIMIFLYSVCDNDLFSKIHRVAIE